MAQGSSPIPTRPTPAIFMDWSTLIGMDLPVRLRRLPARGHLPRRPVRAAVATLHPTMGALVRPVAQEVVAVLEAVGVHQRQANRLIYRQGFKCREQPIS